MIKQIALMAVLAVGIAGCSSKPKIAANPYKDGANHTEPVFYNGKNYQLTIRHMASTDMFVVSIIGKDGRKLGGKPGDQVIVTDVVKSAVRHFACATGQKANVISGSEQHAAGTWNMNVRCE